VLIAFLSLSLRVVKPIVLIGLAPKGTHNTGTAIPIMTSQS
jgi:hypothetical protein